MKREPTFSINKMAQLFNLNRATMYSWIRRGAPVLPAAGPGKAAKMRFSFVLAWRLKFRQDHGYAPDELTGWSQQARERFKVLWKGNSHG
jgi:phage terminase Nu1 subunit (DNA packaging protein)